MQARWSAARRLGSRTRISVSLSSGALFSAQRASSNAEIGGIAGSEGPVVFLGGSCVSLGTAIAVLSRRRWPLAAVDSARASGRRGQHEPHLGRDSVSRKRGANKATRADRVVRRIGRWDIETAASAWPASSERVALVPRVPFEGKNQLSQDRRRRRCAFERSNSIAIGRNFRSQPNFPRRQKAREDKPSEAAKWPR